MIYTVGCGASWGAAYMESICILMEMQWINSACIHSGEFFHGPLEFTDRHTPFLLFLSGGPCREADERVLKFPERYGRKIYTVDTRRMGLGAIDPAVVDVYNQALAEVRKHPLSMRRYMWKVAY